MESVACWIPASQAVDFLSCFSQFLGGLIEYCTRRDFGIKTGRKLHSHHIHALSFRHDLQILSRIIRLSSPALERLGCGCPEARDVQKNDHAYQGLASYLVCV